MHPRSLLRQLTRIPLEKPCDTPWESMVGSENVRHCPSCDRQVYSLSEMTEVEADLRLLNAGEAVPCVRYARNADGDVVHLPAPRPVYFSSPSVRALVVASALGTSLAVEAQEKDKEPVQCVMLNGLVPVTSESAPSGGGAPAAAPAARSAPAPAPPAPPRPIPMGGAAPPPHQKVAYGTLSLRSKTSRDIEIGGLKLKAPLDVFRMTPGDFVLKVDGKKKRTIKFTIKIDEQTTIDLDKK